MRRQRAYSMEELGMPAAWDLIMSVRTRFGLAQSEH
jgi:hypothetical protein